MPGIVVGCRFGGTECMYPCHCDNQEQCDANTGSCPSGCDANNRNGDEYGGDWSGPGCQVGEHKVYVLQCTCENTVIMPGEHNVN